MIFLIIWLVSWFTWLLYETDWMRVRLPVGIISELPQCRYISWNDLENLAQAIPDKQKPFWLKHPINIKTIWGLNNQPLGASMEPLCSWEWLKNRLHIIPEYKIELISATSRYTFRTQSIPVLQDAFRVYRNPYLKVKIKDAQHY